MPKTPNRKIIGLLLAGGMLSTPLGCQLFLPSPTRVPTLSPRTQTAPAVLTATSLAPLYGHVTLISVTASESDSSQDYTLTTQTPRLTGSDDPRAQRFNREMALIVSQAVANFKADLSNLTPTPIAPASSLDLRYELVSPPGNILSIQFGMDGYVTGSAHAYHLTRTANYDLEQGRDLTLDDLFNPQSDYLDVISKYCIDQLSQRDIGFEDFELGATATPDNYRNWNITADGLMITFDEYRVAPYAAGPQTVVVPYKELSSIIRSPGPLTDLIP